MLILPDPQPTQGLSDSFARFARITITDSTHMADTSNRLVLGGTIGPATVTQRDDGTITARAYLTAGDPPTLSVPIRATGKNAAKIADLDAADVVRILGRLAWDAATRRMVIIVLRVRVTGRRSALARRRTSLQSAILTPLQLTTSSV